MKKPRVYLDTSVLGGCFDDNFSPWSNGLMKDIRLGHFRPVISELVIIEIEDAPAQVREKYFELLEEGAQILTVTEDALALVDAYRAQNILGAKFENDMIHIALATVNEVDILVSWNFKHVVHFDKIRRFNAVNEKCGYKPLMILSPREVTNYEE